MDSVKRVLIADSDQEVQNTLTSILARMKVDCFIVESSDDLIKALGTFQPDLIFMDYAMPRNGGEDFLKILRKSNVLIPLIWLHRELCSNPPLRNGSVGVIASIEKPLVDTYDLRDLVRMGIEHGRYYHKRIRETTLTTEQFHQILVVLRDHLGGTSLK